MGLSVIAGLVIVTAMVAPNRISARGSIAVAVMPIAVADGDRDVAVMAAEVTSRLSDGLAKIDNIRVTAPQATPQDSRSPQPDFVVSGELRKDEHAWDVRARMTRTATGEVVWSGPMSVAVDDAEVSLQQSRLAAGIGHPLALRISALLNAAPRPATTDSGSPPGSAKVAIEQATASITQTTRERFAASQTMLEKALAADPDNIDLAVALAALQLRGVQMVWYNPADSEAAEISARSTLERALQRGPSYLPVLEAYCRFLNTTNQFVESLVACARVLSFDPWNGGALYLIGLGQINLGRFEDALATFRQADRFDTPSVSRWTWQLGVGMTYLLMDRSEDALPWLQSSIAITPATGRSYMLLAAAYQNTGRTDEAKAAIQQGLTLRPGTTALNVASPTKNASGAYLHAAERVIQFMIAAGLPER
jgi:tetratricopeptide (TPR) repeat protein